MATNPKTEFLQIRLSPEDRKRLVAVAKADHLEPSTWARRVILQAVERWELEHPREAGPKGRRPTHS